MATISRSSVSTLATLDRDSTFQAAELINKVPDGVDSRKKSRDGEDISMVTFLQPSEMLKGELLLHEAARKNDTETLKLLLSKKVDANAKNNLDRSALHWSAANGHTQAMEILLKAGCDAEAKDKYGMSALLWAAWFGHKDAVRLLVNNGSNIFAKNRQGMNLFHCAAVNNHLGILQFVQDTLDNYNINDIDQNERTALHLAAEKGNLETTEKLLDMKCEVNRKDKQGQTAVHLAAVNGHDEVLKKILLFGVEVDDRDTDGHTALHLACKSGETKAAEILLSHNADANAETTKEDTPLHLAAAHGQCDVIKLLLHNNCKINEQNHHGNTAVHMAAMNNQAEAVTLLVDSYAPLDIGNKRSQTPLHVAVENGFADVVEVLLLAGADIEAKERTGKCALNLASRGSYIGIVDMIIKADRYYANEPKEDVSSKRSLVSEKSIQFKRNDHDCTEVMKDILWKLATKQLRLGEWKKLAHYWGFTENHIRALEHQYTGTNSYRDHGYRLLLIWLHGVKKDDSPIKHLYEGLVGIGKKDLAEQIRTRAMAPMAFNVKNNSSGCTIS